MLIKFSKIKYLLDSVVKVLINKKDLCPFCFSKLTNTQVLDKKAMIIKLVKCPQCSLLVRVPTDSITESTKFYQDDYSQGYTTDCPDDETLKALTNNFFKDSERDYSSYIQLIQLLGIKPAAKILDYGCSWGYGVYQFEKAGYDAVGYEVSVPRMRYAVNKLGIKGFTDIDDIPGNLDVFFSSHVLEHVPDLNLVFDLAKKRLRPGGLFIAITPNGSSAFRNKLPANFHRLWGKVHPILLTDEFVLKNFSDQLILLSRFPLQHQLIYPHDTAHIEEADTWELVFACKYDQGLDLFISA